MKKSEEKKTIIHFTDQLKRKNLQQIQLWKEMGIKPIIFLMDELEKSKKILAMEDAEVYKMKKNGWSRFRQVYQIMRRRKKEILWVEVYGAMGRLGFLYNLAAKLNGFKILLVQRGVVGIRNIGLKESIWQRISTWLQYKLSKHVMYKEPYMEQYISKHSFDVKMFNPNTATITTRPEDPRNIDYIWANRIKEPRHIDWVIEIAQMDVFKDKRFFIIGFLDQPYSNQKKKQIQALNLPNVELLDYDSDVLEYFKKSKYFLLPAELVFGNNSLLESMSYGVVPVVTEGRGGIERLIEDGVQGFVSEQDQKAYTEKMLETLNQDESQWEEMSKAAHQKIQQHYNQNKYKERMTELYQKLQD